MTISPSGDPTARTADDATASGADIAILEALYRQAEAMPGCELLLNSVVDVDDGRAVVRSISLTLGGDARDPHITSCQRVIDSLHRDAEGRWHVDERKPDRQRRP